MLLAQADCATAPPPMATASSACAAAERAFTAAVGAASAPFPAAPTADLRALADRADRYETIVATATARYADLKQCRSDHREIAAAMADLAVARQASAAMLERAATLRAAADRIVAASPSSRLKVAKALAAPPPPEQPYMVAHAASIRARPADGGVVIAELRRGMRVTGPGEPTPAGWTRLTLNDGSLGYVRSDALRPATLNRSALVEARLAARARRGGGDPVVALAVSVRETLPARTAGFASLLEPPLPPAMAAGTAMVGPTAR